MEQIYEPKNPEDKESVDWCSEANAFACFYRHISGDDYAAIDNAVTQYKTSWELHDFVVREIKNNPDIAEYLTEPEMQPYLEEAFGDIPKLLSELSDKAAQERDSICLSLNGSQSAAKIVEDAKRILLADTVANNEFALTADEIQTLLTADSLTEAIYREFKEYDDTLDVLSVTDAEVLLKDAAAHLERQTERTVTNEPMSVRTAFPRRDADTESFLDDLQQIVRADNVRTLGNAVCADIVLPDYAKPAFLHYLGKDDRDYYPITDNMTIRAFYQNLTINVRVGYCDEDFRNFMKNRMKGGVVHFSPEQIERESISDVLEASFGAVTENKMFGMLLDAMNNSLKDGGISLSVQSIYENMQKSKNRGGQER